MAHRIRSLSHALAFALFAVARPASADDPRAEQAYVEGRRAMDEGRLGDACPLLADSQRLEPRLPKLAFLAVCHERLGKTATAWRQYMEIAEQARRAGLANREQQARERAEQLASSLARVRIVRVEPAADVRIEIDGVVLEPAALAEAYPLDPGPHWISASGPGRLPWSSSFGVEAGPRELVVTVPSLAQAPPSPEPGPPEPGPPEPRPPAPSGARLPPRHDRPALASQSPGGAPFVVVGLAALAVGAAGVIVGAHQGVHALAKKDESDALCLGGCSPDGVAAMDDARTASHLSTAAFLVGGVALAGGSVLVVWGATRGVTPTEPGPTHVSLGPGSLVVRGGF